MSYFALDTLENVMKKSKQGFHRSADEGGKSYQGSTEMKEVKISYAAANSNANHVRLNLNYFNERHAKSNKIKTTKYTWYSFLPVFLFEQLQRATNVFQLVSALFNIIPGAGVVTPMSAFSALAFVIAIAAVREILEDLSRAKFDRESNKQLYEVIRNGVRITVFSANILQGDVLILKDGQEVPVDGVLIYSSDPSKQAHVTTASIDGESNLKNRGQVFPAHVSDNYDEIIQQFSTMRARVVVAPPNAVMSEFNGKIAITTCVNRHQLSDSSVDNEQRIGLLKKSFGSKSFTEYVEKAGAKTIDQNKTEVTEINHFLANNSVFRGMRLVNTKFALVGVLYVSKDTKILRNQLPGNKKTSKLENRTNQMIFLMGFVCILLTIGFTTASMSVASKFYGNASYHEEPRNVGVQLLQKFVQNLLISVYLLPVSMYITIEFARFFQAAIIGVDQRLRRWDVFSWMLYNKGKKIKESPYQAENIVQYQAVVKNSIAVENLAEVDIIFSDKTGTLTKNQMTFKSYVSTDLQLKSPNFKIGIDQNTLFALALCNSVIPLLEKDSVSLQGESPDEIAFVRAASKNGLQLFQRNLKYVFYDYVFDYNDERVALRLKYKILGVIPFTSTRKKMSIILKEIGTAVDDDVQLDPSQMINNVFYGTPSYIAEPGKPFILTKGADSLMLPLMDICAREEDQCQLYTHIDDFSRKGLRTLVFGCKQFTNEQEINAWVVQYESIQQLQEQDQRYVEHTQQIEANLKYLCVSAIEDELYDDLRETLSALVEAKIKLWMLTGDKTLTAINIAKAAGLTQDGNQLTYYTKDNFDRLLEENPGKGEEELAYLMLFQTITYYMSKLDREQKFRYQRQLHTVQQLFNKPKTAMNSFVELFKKQQYYNFPIEQTVVLDSDMFRIFMKYNIQHKFFFIAYNAQSVVCCRLSPQEKALLVQLCRHIYPHTTTLAIGDGANDTVMIKTAHIGVGIAGKEGMHACNSSDLTVPQFKFLKRLMFFHGRTSHFRNVFVVNYCIYKSSMVAFINLLYAFESAISGQIITETFILSLYNTFITFFPILWYALTEKDAYEQICQAYPQSFASVHNRYLPNFQSVTLNIVFGLYGSLILYYGQRCLFSSGSIASSGLQFDLYGFYTIAAITLTYVACVRVYVETKIFNVTVLCLLLVALLVLYVVVVCGNWVTWFGLGLQGQIWEIFTNLSIYMIIGILVIVALAPLVLYQAYIRLWKPRISDIMLQSPGCKCVEESSFADEQARKYDKIMDTLDIYQK